MTQPQTCPMTLAGATDAAPRAGKAAAEHATASSGTGSRHGLQRRTMTSIACGVCHRRVPHRSVTPFHFRIQTQSSSETACDKSTRSKACGSRDGAVSFAFLKHVPSGVSMHLRGKVAHCFGRFRALVSLLWSRNKRSTTYQTTHRTLQRTPASCSRSAQVTRNLVRHPRCHHSQGPHNVPEQKQGCATQEAFGVP